MRRPGSRVPSRSARRGSGPRSRERAGAPRGARAPVPLRRHSRSPITKARAIVARPRPICSILLTAALQTARLPLLGRDRETPLDFLLAPACSVSCARRHAGPRTRRARAAAFRGKACRQADAPAIERLDTVGHVVGLSVTDLPDCSRSPRCRGQIQCAVDTPQTPRGPRTACFAVEISREPSPPPASSGPVQPLEVR
jgi:hypothetical protein